MKIIAINNRIKSVDAIRILAIFAVIVIHTVPFASKLNPVGVELNLATILTQLARFAVPFFFVISGYFWAGKIISTAALKRVTISMSIRIITIFLFWSSVYLIQTNIVQAMDHSLIYSIKIIYWDVVGILRSPYLFFLQGTKSHLWFLSSLLTSLLISFLLISLGMIRSLFLLALVLYIIGLMGKAYTDTPIGFATQFNFRNGPFFGLIFFVSGYLLKSKTPNSSWMPYGLVLAALGIFLHFSEIIFINKLYGTTMNQDYLFGTFFFGIGVSLIALSNSRYLNIKGLTFIGPLILGVYAVHFIFVDLLRPLSDEMSGSPAWEICYPILVFFLSVLAAATLSRNRVTRLFVA